MTTTTVRLEYPLLPLLLWEPHPGLELLLTQEGVPFQRVDTEQLSELTAGRFVLFDGSRISERVLRQQLHTQNVPLDIAPLRASGSVDPFEAAIDTTAARRSWRFRDVEVAERVARSDRAAARAHVMAWLRSLIEPAGGIWARLSPYPHPYRSAFSFRADLDERCPADYALFAQTRQPLDDCTTHFVSTHAYGEEQDVLRDLKRLDTQSHGHYHFVYRDEEANRKNLVRAHEVLTDRGFRPIGFAAPEGRWNAGLDHCLEQLGYLYSSDFHLGFDDLPFFPYFDGRFSRVLQVPIHPVCEGLFLEAGADSPQLVGDYLAEVIRSRLAAGMPAFVYGHPERRLARLPQILQKIAHTVAETELLWRVTLSEYARWSRWRAARRWAVHSLMPGVYSLHFQEWEPSYTPSLIIERGHFQAILPLRNPQSFLDMSEIAFSRRDPIASPATPRLVPTPWSIRSTIRQALDWETVTPTESLPSDSVRERLKRSLRQWKAKETSQ